MKYLPYLFAPLAAILVNFLVGMVVVFITFLVFGYGASANDSYDWLVWLSYIGLSVLGTFAFSKLNKKYGGGLFAFTLACWVVVFALELYGISVWTVGVWLTDMLA